MVDRAKGALLGVQQATIASPGHSARGRGHELRARGQREVRGAHPGRVAEADKADLEQVLSLRVRSQDGQLVPLSEIVQRLRTPRAPTASTTRTCCRMIGMIALAGIIVRNSILLVDFINQQVREGMALEAAVINSAVVRAKPIALTALAAMAGAVFILDDPIFSGLAVSLLFGLFVSTVLTLVVIPVVYYGVMRHRVEWIRTATG